MREDARVKNATERKREFEEKQVERKRRKEQKKEEKRRVRESDEEEVPLEL